MNREDLGRFLRYASERFRASQLMVISDADYEAGLVHVREEIDQGVELVDRSLLRDGDGPESRRRE